MNINGTQGSPYQGLVVTRPYDFGTDAIERQRVSLGQSLIDADFEYGLQATKWQTYHELRKFPSFFEVPGSDFTVSNVATDGATLSSNITVYFANNVPSVGSVISVSGLANSGKTADRAEGFFLVTANNITTANTCNYSAKGQITSTANLSTAYTVLRRGGIYNSGTLKIPAVKVTGDGSANVQVVTSYAHGLVAGTPLTANTAGSAFNGNFFVSNVLQANTFNVVCSQTVSVGALASTANIYMQPYSTVTHRPFDGGVLLGINQPSHGASVIRQSKKVFRYQSGKGLLWSSGTLFCPNNDIVSITLSGTQATITTDVPHGVPQTGAILVIKGIASPAGLNGSYPVQSVSDSRTLVVNSTLTGPVTFAEQPRFIISNWSGASVRAGTFDDQNGLFWEFDGQTLFVCRRTSTFQLDGYASVKANSQLLIGQSTGADAAPNLTDYPLIPTGSSNVLLTVSAATNLVVGQYTLALPGALSALGPVSVTSLPNGTGGTTVTVSFEPYRGPAIAAATGLSTALAFTPVNTRFADQLKVDDRITIRGMTHTVTQILGQGLLCFNPPYRGTSDIPTYQPVKCCKIKDFRTPQSLFNRDTLDGLGSSGFKFDQTKMQMLGLQYTWYGAGFVDFMMRGADGNWVYAHRIKNNNVNDEAYMRTGNMPVRYELINEAATTVSTLSQAIGPADTTLTISDPTTYFPSTGTLLIDNEQITYTGKTTTGFTGLTRAAPVTYSVADTIRTFTGAPASNHNAVTSVHLISVTCAPSLTHWGSAFLMDGMFDQDRGYYFNYANTTVAVNSSSSTVAAYNAFAIRLAPSVSNGIVGDIGNRELLNRAQLLLQKLEVTSSNTVNTVGFLNPTGVTFDPTKWININTTANGSQPSFAQIYPGNLIGGTGGPGERIFSTIVQGNNQNNLDLTGLKEMTNSPIGGNQQFPDGPDILLIQITTIGAITGGLVQVNLFWTEAQA